MCDFHHLYAHLLGDICESDYTLLLDSEWHEPEEINPSKVDILDILNKLTPYGLFKLTPIDNL